MKALILLAVVVAAGSANAEVPTGIAEKLVRFGRSGCRYLSSTIDASSRKRDDQGKYASHFGKITKRGRDGRDVVFRVEVPELPGWLVEYSRRSIKVQVPATVALELGDLERLLGKAQAPDVDNAVRASERGSKSARTALDFEIYHPEAQELCRIEVEAEADEREGPQRRVFSFMFWN